MFICQIDAFMPLSVLLDCSKSSNTDIEQHILRQKALSDFFDGKISALDYLNILETTGVDIDQFMNDAIPVLEYGIRHDLFTLR